MESMIRWSEERARAWWAAQPWMVGVNYVTSSAVNPVEMWMDETFDAALIQKELECAAGLGFNSVRVFLPYIVWLNEGRVFERNFDRFLAIADACGIRTLPILFDDCAFDGGADPVYGRQPEPVPGVHNSRWVPSPGFALQDDPAQTAGLEKYVSAIVGGHRDDARVPAWDLYNEPGNTRRGAKCLPLLKNAFAWARRESPTQPLTTSLWNFGGAFDEINAFLTENSDVIGLHAYSPIEHTRALVERYEPLDRPIFVTEWFHRPNGSDYTHHLPFFHEKKIGIWQWGLIVGKTQTNLSWSTMDGGTSDARPPLWQHDLLNPDWTPFSQAEIDLLKRYTRR